jgi:UDP-glucuronate decarboxylase
MNKKTILVAGGAGFIGYHLCDRLLSNNPNTYIIIVDNLFTGSINNVNDLIERHSSKRIEFIRHDVTFPLYLERIDEIYNLASPASPIHYQHDPVQTTKTNVIGSINLLGLAKRINAKILQASTSEVYGDPLVHPQKEDYNGNVNPIGPRSCYDEGKRCAETLFFDYHREHGVTIRVARIFNTYGPRMSADDGRVVSNFINQAIHHKPITLYGDGSQTRSFCYVDDLVTGLIALMNHPDPSFTGPVNLGNPKEFTIRELGEKVLDMLDQMRYNTSSDLVVAQSLPQDDPLKRKPDISLAKKELNWEPSIPLDDGLKQTIQYFLNIQKNSTH